MDGIIFDVDGTLWDSTKIVARTWTQTARENGNPEMEITPHRLHSLFGKLLPDIAKALFPKETPERQLELINLCCEAENQMLLHEPGYLYPGLEDTLSLLSQKYPLYIVSNCQAGYIEAFLHSTGLGHYFRGHLCPGDTGNAKADNIRQIIRENHLMEAIYVGDTDGDFKATREAGIPFVFAAYGFGHVENPDYVIQSPSDLLHIFDI